MTADDYYTLLGISREADKASIKRAYRRLAKQVHPDKSGLPQDRRQFLEAQKAYETLKDDAHRRAYDRRLEAREQRRHPDHTIPIRRRPAGRKPRQTSFHRPSPVQDLTMGRSAPSRQRSGDWNWQTVIYLSSEAARQGAEVPLQIAIPVLCPFCHDRPGLAVGFCPVCGGTGQTEKIETVILQIAPGVQHGRTYNVPVGQTGRSANRLAVTIFIQ